VDSLCIRISPGAAGTGLCRIPKWSQTLVAWDCGLHGSGAGWGLAGMFGHCSECRIFIKCGDFIDFMSDYQILKNMSSP
jgi:hypothetical protein